ncbi:hypothetical protein BRD17_02185 [Halobacteriales archaeon SW_7_68_16]|nr:MAG: hypothetical protein BRD17_02185 [Halobacteriales archaeon SW_7_68_16]
MDVPDLVREALDDEAVEGHVSLDNEDIVCRTPTRTLVYTGDGLLSDEQVEEFPHDLERVGVSESRRKTKFVCEYIDGTRSFTVPSSYGDAVLSLLLEGVLRAESVVDEDESVVGVYRFSELTLIVAEHRMVKLVGELVWSEDYEVYPYPDVTGLAFEDTTVATSIVVSVDGRPQRVKVPSDEGPLVRQTVEEALFAHYDVASLEELNRVVGDDEAGTEADSDTSDIDFGDDIDPLVSDDDDPLAPAAGRTVSDDARDPGETDTADGSGTGAPDDRSMEGTTASASAGRSDAETGGEEPADSRSGEDGPGPEAEDAHTDAESADPGDAGGESREDAVDPVTEEDLAAIADHLEELTEAVDRQNELLKRQHRAIKQLVDQLQD